jgi:hypothetical protein
VEGIVPPRAIAVLWPSIAFVYGSSKHRTPRSAAAAGPRHRDGGAPAYDTGDVLAAPDRSILVLMRLR